MKKLRVLKAFKDKQAGFVRYKDSEFEADNERASQLVELGFVEVVGGDPETIVDKISGTVPGDTVIDSKGEVLNPSYTPQTETKEPAKEVKTKAGPAKKKAPAKK